jgi:hypothetical protein
LALISCGGGEEKAATSEQAEAPAAVAPPVPAGFEPCNTVRFDEVQRIIGVRPRITTNDATGSASEGWATCAFARSDDTPGATYTVRIAKFDSSDAARQRQTEIVGGLTGATALPNDPDRAYVWSDGNSLHLQYQRGWWLQRRTVEGDTSPAARAALIAAPRWP